MSHDGETVIAPGGPRPASSIHPVEETEAVQRTAAGQRVVTQPEHLEKGDQMSEEYVVTPGGYRHKSVVHRLEPGTVLDGTAGRLRALDRSGELLRDFGKLERGKPSAPPADVSHAPPPGLKAERRPELGRGWITDATWTNTDRANPVSLLATTWQVPPEPASDDGQTVFIFNAIKNPAMIYQPVLQWGSSGAGGEATGRWPAGTSTVKAVRPFTPNLSRSIPAICSSA